MDTGEPAPVQFQEPSRYKFWVGLKLRQLAKTASKWLSRSTEGLLQGRFVLFFLTHLLDGSIRLDNLPILVSPCLQGMCFEVEGHVYSLVCSLWFNLASKAS